MKAAVVTSFTAPLEIQDRPDPAPGPGQVLVRIEASGLCHTDIHAAHGDWPVKPTPPFVPGHEGVGIVEALGAGVTDRAVGDRVAIPWLGHACGTATTASAAGRRCARSSRTPATRSTAASPSTPSPTPTTSSPVPDGVTPHRRRAADLRRRHDVQGVKVADVRPDRAGRDLRHRRPRPPRRAVRAASSAAPSIAVDVDRREARPGPRARRRPRRQRRETDPVAAIQELGGADVAVALA